MRLEDFEGFRRYCSENESVKKPRSVEEREYKHLRDDIYNNPKKYGIKRITSKWREVVFRKEDRLNTILGIILMDDYDEVYLIEAKTTNRSRGGFSRTLNNVAEIIFEDFGIRSPRLIGIRKTDSGFHKTEFN